MTISAQKHLSSALVIIILSLLVVGCGDGNEKDTGKNTNSYPITPTIDQVDTDEKATEDIVNEFEDAVADNDNSSSRTPNEAKSGIAEDNIGNEPDETTAIVSQGEDDVADNATPNQEATDEDETDDPPYIESQVSFPVDEYPHGEPIEWYYWTGHLKTDDQRWFGYELVFFVVDMFGQQILIVNHAITDIQSGTFHHTSRTSPIAPPKLGEPLYFGLGGSSALLEDGNVTLHGEVDDCTLQLDLHSVKPTVFHHGNGYIDYPFGGYTYYYSRSRMETDGTLIIEGEPYSVTGTSWFDHQWGELGNVIRVGWDWFAIQLDDNREIMLFTIHQKAETLLLGGSWIMPNGETIEISPDNFKVTPLSEWESPHTGKSYPIGWEILVDDVKLILSPVMEDQEVVSSYKVYWEGACEVSGDATGRAYVELTGY